MSSTVFAVSAECNRMLGSLINHTKEAARLNDAAIQHGFNVYTGQIDQVDNQSVAVKDYMRLSDQHDMKAVELVAKIKTDCLK